jgi:hypothetical protein
MAVAFDVLGELGVLLKMIPGIRLGQLLHHFFGTDQAQKFHDTSFRIGRSTNLADRLRTAFRGQLPGWLCL